MEGTRLTEYQKEVIEFYQEMVEGSNIRIEKLVFELAVEKIERGVKIPCVEGWVVDMIKLSNRTCKRKIFGL